MKKIILFLIIISGTILFAEDFGAHGAQSLTTFTLNDMLKYAIQDEYLALNEYEALIKKFGNIRPYTNIIQSEKTHISMLKELYNSYNIQLPNTDTSPYIVIPESLLEAAKIGVNAEIQNINMYENFLKQNIPSDVRTTFEKLKKASESHLKAFQKQLSVK